MFLNRATMCFCLCILLHLRIFTALYCVSDAQWYITRTFWNAPKYNYANEVSFPLNV
jgi:hypothetical protein